MADTKISALTAVPSASAADIFAVVQGGVTLRETLAQAQATISATNIAATGSLSAAHVNVTSSLTAVAINATSSITAGSVSVGAGASGTYSSGNLTISNGIVTAIP